MSKCNLCGKDNATIPDRDYPSGRKKVCKDCHTARLKEDIRFAAACWAKIENWKREGKD